MSATELSIEKVRSGDQEAARTLFVYLFPRLMVTAAALGLREDDQEDAVSNAMLRIFDSLEKFNPSRGSFSAWAFSVGRRAIYRYYQKMREQSRYEAIPIEDIASTAAHIDGESVLESAISTLPDRERIIFIRHDIEGIPINEIASEFTLSPEEVRKRLLSAREIIRAALTPTATSDEQGDER